MVTEVSFLQQGPVGHKLGSSAALKKFYFYLLFFFSHLVFINISLPVYRGTHVGLFGILLFLFLSARSPVALLPPLQAPLTPPMPCLHTQTLPGGRAQTSTRAGFAIACPPQTALHYAHFTSFPLSHATKIHQAVRLSSNSLSRKLPALNSMLIIHVLPVCILPGGRAPWTSWNKHPYVSVCTWHCFSLHGLEPQLQIAVEGYPSLIIADAG